MAFKDPKLRDIFNGGLRKIKRSGQYQRIIEDYIHGHIEQQVELVSLISALVANSIFNENSSELN